MGGLIRLGYGNCPTVGSLEAGYGPAYLEILLRFAVLASEEC
jgi:hypothetical protein